MNAVALPGVDELAAALPLRADTIATKSGALVLERRRTAWLAEPGIGALAYSGEVSASFHVRRRVPRRQTDGAGTYPRRRPKDPRLRERHARRTNL